MSPKTTARLTGALFLTATTAGIAGAALLDPSPRAGALLIAIMGAAVALIPPTLFPVLKAYGEAAALGYVAMRILEVVLFLPVVLDPEHPGSPTAQLGSSLFFCVSVVLLNVLLYRSRLVPRWLPLWALITVAPYLAGAALVGFGALESSSGPHAALFAPLGLNELALAGWLLVKGFRPAAAPIDDRRLAPAAAR
jgi:hypothetical protein